MAGLISDPLGNLYGTTAYGGNYGGGTVFQVRPEADGSWTETVLHSFQTGEWPESPRGGVIIDSEGTLYGTTMSGSPTGYGSVFELRPIAGRGWEERILHAFDGGPDDGAWPEGSLIFDDNGNLYGTTHYGGRNGYGTVFEVRLH
jgi:uncharacterized repeat protein (TIGR03803 family)